MTITDEFSQHYYLFYIFLLLGYLCSKDASLNNHLQELIFPIYNKHSLNSRCNPQGGLQFQHESLDAHDYPGVKTALGTRTIVYNREQHIPAYCEEDLLNNQGSHYRLPGRQDLQ
jgi:hypothetical protein